ncbi:Mitochondrial ATP synthase delta chain [Trichostrongylus colubriformis]|uniref:Mitochondrial ATP synthase delta chain n=1 Tax=Trichostrongylus colubriformis TaxID=6319 RepID=A0AAN8ENR7_TRICO
MVGVLANHVPTIGVLKPGVVTVTDNEGKVTKLFVSSGTMSMNIDGTCQVLAEEVVKVEDIDQSAARTELEAAQRAAVEGSDVAKAEAQIRVEVADALLKAATGQQ